MSKKFVIIGSGWSGLFAANYLESKGADYTIITTFEHGFSTEKTHGIPYSLGQRTLFYGDYLNEFLTDTIGVGNYFPQLNDLSESIGVHYKGDIFRYPIQHHLSSLNFGQFISAMFSSFFRKRSLLKKDNYADWVRGNYGDWLADNIILPHTWKTMKEDLFSIKPEEYGKKVVSFIPPWKKKQVKEIANSTEIMNKLYDRVKHRITMGRVKAINPEHKAIVYTDKTNIEFDETYDVLINTMPLNFLINMIEGINPSVEGAGLSLRYNNLFLGTFFIPSELINTDKAIVYFPEREYCFSKVTIQHHKGLASITCELSFRRNDEQLYRNELFLQKLRDKIELHLKQSGIVGDSIFAALSYKKKIVSPAYIICDEDYGASNCIIQSYLKAYDILNFGRFAEWKPNLRVENIPERVEKALAFEIEED